MVERPFDNPELAGGTGTLPAEERLLAGQAERFRSGVVVVDCPANQPDRLTGADLGDHHSSGQELSAITAEQPRARSSPDRQTAPAEIGEQLIPGGKSQTARVD